MTVYLAVWILVVVSIAIVFVLLRMQRRVARGQKRMFAKLANEHHVRTYRDVNEYRQLTAFYQLHDFLAPCFPLPPMRDWAISPDFAVLLVRLIRQHKPARIVEFGSGCSTLICSYCLKQMGAGEIISIDHDPAFAERTRDDLRMHGLSEWADVRVAELYTSRYQDDVQQPIDWYDAEVVDALPAGIDLVIIDGPPSKDRALARYPALSAVIDRLSAGAAIILDDADRPEEQAVLARWRREVASIHYHHEPTEKGAAVLTLISGQEA